MVPLPPPCEYLLKHLLDCDFLLRTPPARALSSTSFWHIFWINRTITLTLMRNEQMESLLSIALESEASKNGDTSSALISISECPGGCNQVFGQGSCTPTGCSCTQSYIGDNCQSRSDVPPMVRIYALYLASSWHVALFTGAL